MTVIAKTDLIDMRNEDDSPEEVAAAALDVTIVKPVYETNTVYDASKSYAEVYEVEGGRFMAFVCDDLSLKAALLSECPDYEWDAYNDRNTHISIARATGLPTSLWEARSVEWG